MAEVVGIIGGMGPASTLALMHKIVERTPATCDQEHIRMLVDNRPQIPDRTAFILGKGVSPVPMLQESAQGLQTAGADFLAIACNTAHFFFREIATAVTIPVLNMLELLAVHLCRQFPPGSQILLLATTGSLRSGLFQPCLAGFEVMVPSASQQANLVMAAIYGETGIKSGGDLMKNRNKLQQAIVHSTTGRRPACVIAGCTEIAEALEDIEIGFPIVNPLDLLASAVVERATRMS